MLRNLLLGGVSPLICRKPDDETGAAELPLETPAEAKSADPATAAPAADAAPATTDKQKPTQKDWRDHVITRKTAQVKEKEAALAQKEQRERELAEENARLREMVEAANRRAPVEGDPPRDPAPRREPVRPAAPMGSDDDRIRAAAATLVAQQTAEQQMDAAVTKGKGEYGAKWDAAIANLQTLGGFDPDTLVGILATDDPAKALFELGHDPGDGSEPAYLRIMALPPAKRLYEIAKIVNKVEAPPPKPKVISDAAPPIEPITQAGTAVREKPFDIYDQKFTLADAGEGIFPSTMKGDSDANDAKWFEERRKQKENSVGRPWSRPQARA